MQQGHNIGESGMCQISLPLTIGLHTHYHSQLICKHIDCHSKLYMYEKIHIAFHSHNPTLPQTAHPSARLGHEDAVQAHYLLTVTAAKIIK
jgi:hypothetical protein